MMEEEFKIPFVNDQGIADHATMTTGTSQQSHTISDIFIHGVHSLFETSDRPIFVASNPIQNDPFSEDHQSESEAFTHTPACRILKFLTTRELCVMKRVCRATNYLVSTRVELWDKIDLSGCSPFAISDEVVISLLENSPKEVVKSISLRFLTQLTNQTLKYISSHFITQLRRLDLEGCSRKMDDEGLALLSRMTNLTHLSLAGCFKLSARGVMQILSGCTHLVSLDVSSVPCVNDVILEALGSHPNLHTIKINGCSGITDSGLRALATGRGGALLSLDLAYCDRVTDRGLDLLTNLAPNLEHISLYCCQKITDAGVDFIIRRCLNIASLNLSLLPLITNDTLLRLAYQNHLSWSTKPTEDQFIPPKLKTLVLYGCRQMDDKGFSSIQKCLHLTHLDLFSSVQLSRNCAAWILLSVKGLRRLNIGGCPRISNQDIADLSKHFPHIRFGS